MKFVTLLRKTLATRPKIIVLLSRAQSQAIQDVITALDSVPTTRKLKIQSKEDIDTALKTSLKELRVRALLQSHVLEMVKKYRHYILCALRAHFVRHQQHRSD